MFMVMHLMRLTLIVWWITRIVTMEVKTWMSIMLSLFMAQLTLGMQWAGQQIWMRTLLLSWFQVDFQWNKINNSYFWIFAPHQFVTILCSVMFYPRDIAYGGCASKWRRGSPGDGGSTGEKRRTGWQMDLWILLSKKHEHFWICCHSNRLLYLNAQNLCLAVSLNGPSLYSNDFHNQ